MHSCRRGKGVQGWGPFGCSICYTLYESVNIPSGISSELGDQNFLGVDTQTTTTTQTRSPFTSEHFRGIYFTYIIYQVFWYRFKLRVGERERKREMKGEPCGWWDIFTWNRQEIAIHSQFWAMNVVYLWLSEIDDLQWRATYPHIRHPYGIKWNCLCFVIEITGKSKVKIINIIHNNTLG